MPKAESEKIRSSSQRSISQPGKGIAGAIAVFLLILLFGLATWIPVFILPVVRLVRARRWPAVTCTIVASSMTSERDQKGALYYRAHILYRYWFAGHVYSAQRYSVDDLATTNKRSVAALVARYHPGTHALCFINPADPSEALLNRSWDWSLSAGLVPLFFVFIGGGGLVLVIRLRRRQSLPGGAALASNIKAVMPMPLTDTRAAAPIALRAHDGPVGTFCLALILAVGWNAIFGFLFALTWKGWFSGRDVWLNALQLPFLGMGVALIVWTFFRFAALFNPRPKLILSHREVALGQSAYVKWNFRGRYDRIRRLEISLEGREEATYPGANDTHTDRHVFYRQIIAEVTRRIDIVSGKATLIVPAASMHSFSARNNAIIWSLKLHGEIDGWPDVREEFPIEVTV